MTFETLTISALDGIEAVTMNRPEVANALNARMGLDLFGYFEDLSLDPGRARAVILTGAGSRAFCAGGDLKERRGMTDAMWAAQHRIYERMARAMLACPVPVIAAVNGAAYGGGCEIALACDFIYASDTARFAMTEVTLGIIPGAGGTHTLARALGERRAKELILSARPFSAAEAAAWGMINQVLPPDALLPAAQEIAARIGRNAPLAVRQAKQAIARGGDLSVSDGLAFEIEAY